MIVKMNVREKCQDQLKQEFRAYLEHSGEMKKVMENLLKMDKLKT